MSQQLLVPGQRADGGASIDDDSAASSDEQSETWSEIDGSEETDEATRARGSGFRLRFDEKNE